MTSGLEMERAYSYFLALHKFITYLLTALGPTRALIPKKQLYLLRHLATKHQCYTQTHTETRDKPNRGHHGRLKIN